MKIKVYEFINAKDPESLISGDAPPLDPKTTSKSTTDQAVQAQAQTGNWGNYRRYYGESELPFTNEADLMQEEPGKFYDFLREKGMEANFESYFAEQLDLKESLKEAAKINGFSLVSKLLSQQKPTPTLQEIMEKDELVVKKLEKLAVYCSQNLSEDERKVIATHVNKLING